MIERAASHGITVLGPNCLGFLNAHAPAAPFALTVPLPLRAGPVGIALQSGALASVVLAFARAHAIGVSTLTTMGNEAMIAATDVLEYLIEDDATQVICLFLEQISDPDRFARAAQRADLAGKPIVVLKVGASPAGRQAALAHTGAIVGDDAVVDAVLRQLNVIRVASLEELLATAALLGYDRQPQGRRMGVVSTSGGACDLIADRASAENIEIPEFAPDTAAAITPLVPSFAAVRNPIDVTGYFLANRRTSALTPVDQVLDVAVADPGLDFVVFTGLTLPDAPPPDPALAGMLEQRAAWLGQRIASAPIPVITVGHTCVNVSDYGRELLTGHGIQQLPGIDLAMTALGHALRWSENRGRPQAQGLAPGPAGGGQAGPECRVMAESEGGEHVWSEADARELLAGAGVPVVPGELVGSADAAVAAARRLGFPAVLKICSAQISHKSDVGGVALGLRSEAEVRAAYARVAGAGRSVAGARIDGVLVSPMRAGGVELVAGVTVDPAFGPVLAVGLGGIWVEVLKDVSLRVLPVDPAEVRRMLTELRGAALLAGSRGTRPASLDALAEVIWRIGQAALRLNEAGTGGAGALRALEVNPLWVDGDRVEALDVLIVTEQEPPGPRGAAPGGTEPRA
jgi:acyl-CoA synthetase (NDP forming)